MEYIKVTFAADSQEAKDMLSALLTDVGYDGFEESASDLLAYIEKPKFDEDELKRIADQLGILYDREIIAPQNWNALWESNFPPVVIGGFCTVRAHFHDLVVTTPYDIIITPKMSFGTGHHATTQLVMTLMKDIDFDGKKVLDFGTGTGVLAILAAKLGAKNVTAIDNDVWSIENAGENVERNSSGCVTVKLASIEGVNEGPFDVVLANINRFILLQYMGTLYEKTSAGGLAVMSGILAGDVAIVTESATGAGFVRLVLHEQSNWAALVFQKI